MAVHPSLVCSVLLETEFARKRVLVLGDATSPLALALVEAGARSVHVVDPERARLAAAAQSAESELLSFATMGQESGIRDGAFDVVIVADVGVFRDAVAIVRRARRAVTPSGILCVVSRNPDAQGPTLLPHDGEGSPIAYYELYDLIAADFEHVRVFGQAPFVGYTLADFAPESEPDVSVDNSMVGGGAEEAEFFVIVGSARSIDRLDAFTVMGVPWGDVAQSWIARSARYAQRQAPAAVVPPKPDPEALARAEEQRERIERLSHERDDVKKALERAERELARRTAPAQSAPPASSHVALERAQLRIAELEAELSRRAVDLVEAHAGATVIPGNPPPLNLGVPTSAAPSATAERSAGREQSEETARWEALLKERAAKIADLERQLVESDRIAKELVLKTKITAVVATAAPAVDTNAQLAALEGEVLALGQRAVEREANLQSAEWRIQELEERVAQLSMPLDEVRATLERALARCQAELTRLRDASSGGPGPTTTLAP